MKNIVVLLILSILVFGFEFKSNSNSLCYKTKTIMYPKDIVFDALKKTLMASHLNIETVTNKDGVLLAKGSQYNEDEDTVTYITVSISFKELGENKTKVTMIASYSTSEKKSDTGQLGIAGVTLPIPVPFTQKYAVIGSGNIDDPIWYQAFFNSLDKMIFEIVMLDNM